MPPLRFLPLIKRARWGGTRLGTVLHKPIAALTDAAESWELVDHSDDQSIVLDGPWCGRTLGELVRQHGPALLGRHLGWARFPLLLKFIDAQDRLSVQVHPNDAQAHSLQPGESGKTEAWVILAAEPGSRIFAGLKAGVDRPVLERALRQGCVEECLHGFTPRAGDCVFIPAGTVHAIGEGILLAEVQQTSDLTLRLDDWGRLGSDGQPRPLHIAQSLECIDFSRGPVNPTLPRPSANDAPQCERLVDCDYFDLRRHQAAMPFDLPKENQFQILMLLEGNARLCCGDGEEVLRVGDTVLLPAAAPVARVVPEGSAVLLEVRLP
jgi:mannose-6-phosphate isomerase